MCGIIGYVGNKQAAPILLQGLKRLEYRGYDSSGIAVINDNTVNIIKTQGKISALSEKTDNGTKPIGKIGIGHTRWATHGKPSDINSHPHLSANGQFAIVHNGIIENYAELKAELEQNGIVFTSETDSEVIAQLLQTLYNGNMTESLVKVISRLKGSYAVGIVCANEPDALYAIRKDNPLIIGLGKNENFIVSDFAAALEHTHEFVHLNDGEIARLTSRSVSFCDSISNRIEKTPFHIEWDFKLAEKDGYPHFMLKEIYEQPRAIKNVIGLRVKGQEIVPDKINLDANNVNRINRIDIVGCGSAYHAGLVGKCFIEKYCRIRVNCELASEYIYSDPITDNRTLTIVISQSGETADTIAAMRLAKSRGSHTIAIVNVIESTIAREADDVLYTFAGTEVSVATTKGYTTQVAALYLLGLKISKVKHFISDARYNHLLSELIALPDKIKTILNDTTAIKDCAEQFADFKCIFFIGRGHDYAASMEGALKLKEISYIHSEAYAAGELKHGTISLIEKNTLTVALITQSDLYGKTLSNIKSVIARLGTVIAVATPRTADIKDVADKTLFIPECDDDLTPILVATVLQLFAYYIASKRGCEIDTPRNLAKSVTVE